MALIPRLRSLALRDLEAVVTLARTRHFGRAADECGMTQPSLSALVRRVEDALDLRLFERTSRRVDLTSDGVFVVEAIGELMRGLDRIDRRQRDDGTLSGPVRIGMIPTLGPYYTPHFLADLLRTFPGARFHFHEALTDHLVSLVRGGRLDAALLALPLETSDLAQAPLFEEELVMAFPHEHPRARRTSRLKHTDVPHDDVILLEPGHCLRAHALAACGGTAAGTGAGVQATGLETLRYMVGAKVGCAVFPALAVNGQNACQELVSYRRFAAPVPTRTIGLVSRMDGDAQRIARTLVGFLQNVEVPNAL
jgi:LysR family transcriptional regulator, hydrogen peroxide-inducible genes activator